MHANARPLISVRHFVDSFKWPNATLENVGFKYTDNKVSRELKEELTDGEKSTAHQIFDVCRYV